MENLEIEIKFYLTDIRTMRRRLVDLGARSQGRIFEKNLRFEDANQTLKSQKNLLRLRQDIKSTLTFKSTPSEKNKNFKTLNEMEITVSDFDTTRRILKALGYNPVQTYEKWRETLVIQQTHFCLDTMPYGNFIEIEGSPKDIIRYTKRLGLNWDRRILMNYLEIFDILKEKLHLKFTDVTFDHFEDIVVKLNDYLDLIETEARGRVRI